MHGPASDLPIEFENTTILAGEAVLLDDITVKFAAGRPVVLIGPNGAGKTTLLRAAMGLVSPSRGRITFGGRERVPPRRRAFMFQRPAMLRRSAAGNLRFALSAAGIPRARHDARIAELLDLVGLDGLADRPARRLSGGEQQRLALARALARAPEVLFLDEPAASLDPAATRTLEETIRRVARDGITVILSTHDLAQARRIGGDIVFMNRGRVVETGDSEAFFIHPETDEARRFIAGELLT